MLGAPARRDRRQGACPARWISPHCHLIRASTEPVRRARISYRMRRRPKFPVLKDLDRYRIRRYASRKRQVRPSSPAGASWPPQSTAIFDRRNRHRQKPTLHSASSSAVIRTRPGALLSTWSISSTSWSRRRLPVAREPCSPRSCCATISSSSTSWATSRSARPGGQLLFHPDQASSTKTRRC